MVKKFFVLQLFLQLLFVQLALSANPTDYQKGWEFFSKNDRVEARKSFNEALNNPDTKSDALLSLSLLEWNENHLEAAFANFQKFYETSPNPYPYFYALSSLPILFEAKQILSPAELAFYEKIVLDPKLNGTQRASVYEHLGTHYAKMNNQQKATEYYNKMGTLKNWQVLGSFDNTSGSGYSKDWGAVSKARSTDVFKNKVDADVTWYAPKYNNPNNWFYFDYYFYLNNSIMYAQTFVNSPVAQEVYLRAGTSGSLKVWVNDALVAAVPEERNCDLDIYAYKVKINQGNNRILVQIGASDIDRANFLVRLTDENANPISNISSSDVYADYTVSTEKYNTTQLPFFAEEYFLNQIEKSKDNPLNYFLLSEIYLRNDKSYEAIKALKHVESVWGKSTLSSYRLHEAYVRAQNQTDYEQETETIKNTDPNSIFAMQTKFDEAIESEKYSDAEEICANAKKLYGESSITDDWDLKIASYQKRFEDVIALAKKLYKNNPTRADYMQLNYIIELNVNKKPKAAIAIMEKFCKSISDDGVLGALAKAYLDQGMTEKGLATLYKRLSLNPYAVGYYDNLMSTLFGMQRYNEALAVSEKALALAPYISNVYNTRGFIYKNMNNADKARENFNKSIYYSPTNYDSRNQLRLLDNKKEMYELFPKTNLQNLIDNAPVAKDFPEDNSIVLLNEYQHIVYPEGAKEYRYEIATKILNQSGIETWKEYGIGYNGYSQKLIVDKAEVIKANGNVVKAETDDDNQVVFTNLEVNDVLHLEYRIQDLSTGKLAKQFFDHFLFKYSIPSVVNKYSLLIPENKKFNYKVVNGSVEPVITTVENMKLYTWELNNQPAVKSESHMSELIDIMPALQISTIDDWSYVSDWYKDLTTSKFKSDYVLKETVAELMKDKTNLTDLEKAKIFYNYILENIAYSSVDFLQSNYIPQKASRTITTRLGDCKDLSTLFVTLCREVGVNANLVLISTRNNGNNGLVLPSIGFNHCIAQLNVNNRKYYLELTDNNLPFGAAIKEDLNAQILPIPFGTEKTDDKLIRLEMPERMLNSSVRKQLVSFAKNDMLIDRKQQFYGSIASYQRAEFKNVGAEEQLKNMNEAVASNFDVSVKVTDLGFDNLENLADSMSVAYKVEVKNAVQDVAGMKIFKFPWTDTNSLDIVAAEKREFPMDYWAYQTEDRTKEILTIELPQGKKMVEAPQNVKLECPSALYSLVFDTKIPGKLVVTRYFERKQDQIAISDYASFRDFLNKVSENDNKQYAFK